MLRQEGFLSAHTRESVLLFHFDVAAPAPTIAADPLGGQPMAKISKAQLKAQENARKNRQELIGVDRRDLMKMGLLTSAGFLVPKRGLSARARNSAGWLESGSGSDGSSDDIPCQSPPTTPFVEEMPNHMNGGMVIHTPVAAF